LRGKTQIALGTGLLGLAVLPPVAGWLEASLVRHLLGQYPLLVGGGALIGAALARRGRVGWSAAPALLAGALALAFWLIPRWVDAAVADTATDAAKVTSLVVLAGLPLGWGWRLAGPVLRGFVWANAAAMLAVMGWLQLAAPSRLCNNYLIGEQVLLGRMLLLLAALMIAVAASAALTGTGRSVRSYIARQRLYRQRGARYRPGVDPKRRADFGVAQRHKGQSVAGDRHDREITYAADDYSPSQRGSRPPLRSQEFCSGSVQRRLTLTRQPVAAHLRRRARTREKGPRGTRA